MKNESLYTAAVIGLVRRLFAHEDPALAGARERAAAAGLPLIEVAPEDGALLGFLVASIGARRVVEIGTLFGYSAIWMARALPPEGRIITLEANARHAEVAERNLEIAGVGDFVEVRVGPALELLAGVEMPVDFVFIDADKESYPAYLKWARGGLRPGGLVAVDNAFLRGQVADPTDSESAAVRRLLDDLAGDPAWHPAIVPTLAGMALAIRTAAD